MSDGDSCGATLNSTPPFAWSSIPPAVHVCWSENLGPGFAVEERDLMDAIYLI